MSHPRTATPKRLDYELVWKNSAIGVFVAEDQSVLSIANSSRIVNARTFAVVRPAFGADGLYNEQHGFVVSRNSFDEVRQFPTLDEAKLYVESLYELEK